MGQKDSFKKEIAVHSTPLSVGFPREEESGMLKSHGVARESDMTKQHSYLAQSKYSVLHSS